MREAAGPLAGMGLPGDAEVLAAKRCSGGRPTVSFGSPANSWTATPISTKPLTLPESQGVRHLAPAPPAAWRSALTSPRPRPERRP